jgi:O-acetyl-ADP-ribose deacetylase (regulator of RNase III)
MKKMIHFTKGDMFDVEVDIRVNTVNCKGVMGAGVALAFKNRYPDMFLDYRNACLAEEIQPGKMYVWKGAPEDWIINFPTKRHWREKSRYEDIELGLLSLHEYLKEFPGIRVALPALGCGNGGLDWKRVAPMIEEKLSDLNAEIYVFEPADSLSLGRKIKNSPYNETMRDLALLGFHSFELPVEYNFANDLSVQVKGNAELLANRWIALWTSREVSERELGALTSIASQMGQYSSPPTVALIYQNSASEEIAEIFLKNGLAVVLLLPFSPRVKKRIGLADHEQNRITYAILSFAENGGGKIEQIERFANELLMLGAQAILLSDPDPNLKGKKTFKLIEDRPCFFVRYATQSNDIVHYLEQKGFRSIGRRADTGEPNLAPIIESQNNTQDILEGGAVSKTAAFVSSDQLRLLADMLDVHSLGQSGLYLSLVTDLIPDDMRAEIEKILHSA